MKPIAFLSKIRGDNKRNKNRKKSLIQFLNEPVMVMLGRSSILTYEKYKIFAGDSGIPQYAQQVSSLEKKLAKVIVEVLSGML
jgi:hypothetical protein